MSKKKARRYQIWVEEGGSPISPEIRKLLPTAILDFVLVEDLTGPACLHVERGEYVKQLAERLREPLLKLTGDAGITVTEEQMAEVCRLAASEAFVIRGLNEARIVGEIPIEQIRELPFYNLYKEYFEQTPEIMERALELAFAAVQSTLQQRTNN